MLSVCLSVCLLTTDEDLPDGLAVGACDADRTATGDDANPQKESAGQSQSFHSHGDLGLRRVPEFSQGLGLGFIYKAA